MPLPHILWGLCAVGATKQVTDTLARSKARTAADLHADVDRVISALPERDRFRLEQRAAEIERRQEERIAWHTQADVATTAAAMGTLDGMLLALGQHSEWLEQTVSSTPINDGMAAGLQGLIEHKLMLPTFEDFAPDATAAISAWLGNHVVEPVVDGVDAVGEGAVELLGGAADFGIPITTTLLAVKKAVSSSNAGLESERVAENFAWDLGARGGSVAAGAAVGTAILPVVGTVIGGLIGGFVGGGIASEGKTRHLRRAIQASDAARSSVGLSVSEDKWRSLGRGLERSLREEQRELDRLRLSAKTRRRLWPRLGDIIIKPAIGSWRGRPRGARQGAS